MSRKLLNVLAGLCVFAISAVWVVPALAQTEIKEKPPIYSYVGNWAVPRVQWGEMTKQNAEDQKVLEKAFADGTIIAYGTDMTLIHSNDGDTHDQWWSANSMAGLLHVL